LKIHFHGIPKIKIKSSKIIKSGNSKIHFHGIPKIKIKSSKIIKSGNSKLLAAKCKLIK